MSAGFIHRPPARRGATYARVADSLPGKVGAVDFSKLLRQKTGRGGHA